MPAHPSRPALAKATAGTLKLWVSLAAAALAAFAALPAAFPGPAGAATIPGHYIVVLKDSVSDPGAVARDHARSDGAQVSFVYRHALKGYAAAIADARLDAVKRDPRVLYVAPDTEVSAAQTSPPPPPPQPAQVFTSSLDRIDAEQSSTVSGDGSGSVNVNVAVIDTGIDSSHPDLNVVGGVDCTSGKGFEDPNGHGTMVAGAIGALDNAIGVVGVAPGANLWAVRVLNKHAGAPSSKVICGIDWVTSTRSDGDPNNDIAVANMSLAGTGSDDGNCGLTKHDPEHQAICRSTAAGVTYVVGAGNDSADYQTLVPASYDEVLTATGMVDTDGKPGGLGPVTPCLGDPDDTPASFSSFATLATDQAHTLSAPAECITSTYPGGLYAYGSGTSLAAPRIAGTVALCIASGNKPCAGLTPKQIVAKIVADDAAYNTANPGYGFTGDPLHSPDPGKYYGYLIRAGLY